MFVFNSFRHCDFYSNTSNDMTIISSDSGLLPNSYQSTMQIYIDSSSAEFNCNILAF